MCTSTPEAHNDLARRSGLQVVHVHDKDKSWDFKTRSAFEAFGSVTFVEWTRLLPAQEEPNFIGDVLDRYRLIASEKRARKTPSSSIRWTSDFAAEVRWP